MLETREKLKIRKTRFVKFESHFCVSSFYDLTLVQDDEG